MRSLLLVATHPFSRFFLASGLVLSACAPDAPPLTSDSADGGVRAEWLRVVDDEQRDAPEAFAITWRGAAALLRGGLLGARVQDARLMLAPEESLHAARVGDDPLEAGAVTVVGNTLEIARGELTEWMVNGPRGIEHGFVVPASAAAGDEVAIDVEIEGLRATSSAHGALLSSPEGAPRYTYTELHAWDADGRELPSVMLVSPQQIRLVVDTTGARFPLVVDPLLAPVRATLEAADGAADHEFGISVSIDGDRLAVGSRYGLAADGEDEGAVYMYERSAGVWAAAGRVLARADVGAVTEGHRRMHFGFALDLEGDSLVVGASDFDSPAAGEAGAVYTYRRVGGAWVHEQDLIGHSPLGAGYRFGRSVSLSGNLMVVGEPGSREWFTNAGAAYVYSRTGMTWTEITSLSWSSADANDDFGRAVAVDGTRIAVGAPNDEASGGRDLAGAVFIYQRIASSWTETARLQPASLDYGDKFGTAISLEGDWLAVGAFEADDDGDGFVERRGVVYVFERVAGTWTERDRIHPPAGPDWPTWAHFGQSVSLSGDILAVGAPGVGTGRVFVYRRASDGTYAEEVRFGGRVRTDGFGYTLSLDGADLAVGAPDEHIGTIADQGAAYVVELVDDASAALGDPCVTAGECISGFCVDGVCCDGECGFGDFEDCMACSVATGAAVDGTCGARSTGASCRAPIGVCDAEEICDGTSLVCPADALESEGTICRPAGLGCDSAEACDGINPVCPADTTAGEGSMCNDGMACTTGEVCTGGVCGGGATLACDDGNPCTADACEEPAGCAATPIAGCCLSNADCDDGDACTDDVCASNVCSSTPTAACTDAAVGADAGPARDAGGAADGGSVVASTGGCCAVAGARSDARFALLIAAALGLALRSRKGLSRRRCP